MVSQIRRPYTDEENTEYVTVVHFAGDQVFLSEENYPSTHDQLVAVAEQPGRSPLVLDMSNVASVSSMALGMLVKLHKRWLAAGRRLTLCNLSPQVYDVFPVTRLDMVLNLRPAQQGVEPSHQCSRDGHSLGVLVVDDAEEVRSVLETGLRREGYKVFVAADGHEAVGSYQRHREEIAVVLLDVQMPGVGGPKTLAALQKLDPAIRCCFMTGNAGPYAEADLLRTGAVRVFRKPFVFAEVVRTLGQLAGQSSLSRLDRWIAIP
jgi:anti-anti-sigma factor